MDLYARYDTTVNVDDHASSLGMTALYRWQALAFQNAASLLCYNNYLRWQRNVLPPATLQLHHKFPILLAATSRRKVIHS
jgi:hypothetical protein